MSCFFLPSVAMLRLRHLPSVSGGVFYFPLYQGEWLKAEGDNCLILELFVRLVLVI